MKKICTLLPILFWGFQLALQAQWRPAKGPYGGAVWDLKSNAAYVFATQSNGIYRSAAAGGPWEPCDTARVHHLTVQGAVVLTLSYEHNYLRYSGDNGAHWKTVSLPDSMRFARDWAVKDGVILVSASQRLWRSTDQGNTWKAQQLAGEPEHAYDAVEVVGDWFYLANQSRLFRSTDGLSWNALAPLPGASPFVSIFQLYGRNNVVLAFTGPTLFRSADGGKTWGTATVPAGSLGPLPPNFAVQGKYWYAASGRLLVSLDEGASWQLAPGHEEAAADLWAAAANDVALLCGSQTRGVYETNAEGPHFYAANEGLAGAMVSDVAALGDVFYAWDAQGISSTVFPTFSWDTLHLLPMPSSGAVFGDLFVHQKILFAKQAGGALQRSTDGGKNWQPLTLPGWVEQEQPFRFETKGDTLFITAAGGGLWQTVDAGGHWTDAAAAVFAQSGLRADAVAFQNGAALLLSGAVLYRSVDNLKTWTAVGNSPGNGVRLFATASRLFALVPGSLPQLFVSSDAGQSWQLTDIRWPLAFNGEAAQRVSIFQWGNFCLGAFERGGIFVAAANGLHWQGFDTGLPAPSKIKDLAFNGQVWLAGTGEGLFWRLTSDLTALSSGESPGSIRLQIAPNPTRDVFSIAMSGDETGTLDLYNGLGQWMLHQVFKGATVVDVSSFPPGVYRVWVRAGGKSGQKSIVKW